MFFDEGIFRRLPQLNVQFGNLPVARNDFIVFRGYGRGYGKLSILITGQNLRFQLFNFLLQTGNTPGFFQIFIFAEGNKLCFKVRNLQIKRGQRLRLVHLRLVFHQFKLILFFPVELLNALPDSVMKFGVTNLRHDRGIAGLVNRKHFSALRTFYLRHYCYS